MPEVTPPLFLNVDSFYGADELGLPYRDLIGEGALGYADLLVAQRGAGANMSVDVGAGAAWIMGDTTPAAQPQYRVRSDSTVNLAITTAHATLPRIDMVVAEVLDATFTGASNLWRLRVIAGTATSGATLDNRTGAAALPDSAIPLGDVLVDAAVASIVTAKIRDRRPFAIRGVVPPLLTKADIVQFTPAEGLILRSASSLTHTTDDLHQGAALMYLPRRIVSATRMRWRYQNNSGPAGGNYVLAIFDASGRRIIDTGSIAIAGTTGTIVEASLTITATTFEAGAYYVFIGCDTTAGVVSYYGAHIGLEGSGVSGCGVRNTALMSATGGVTVPTTLLSMTDVAGLTAAGNYSPDIPMVSLSVG